MARQASLRRRLTLLAAALFLLPARVVAAELLAAAAADLSFALKEIVQAFERQSGHKVKLSLGSSGNFYSQIVNGAPFDLYFSADLQYPQKLQQAELAEADSLFVYAIGQLVVWIPAHSPVDAERLGMRSLVHPSVRKIAIANPAHAPYGRAAVAALKHFQVYEQTRKSLVYGENVLQTAQFVQSGAADIGLIALSLALSPPLRQAGRYWTIPQAAYPALEQGGVILHKARINGKLEPARAFREWVRGPAGRSILEHYGFLLPPLSERKQR